MAKTYKIRLAGQEFVLRYRSRDRAALERMTLEIGGNALGDCLIGARIEEHALVVWAGLRHLDLKPELTVEQIMDMIDEHNEKGGHFHKDTYRPIVLRCVLESKVIGVFPPHVIDSLCGDGPMAAQGMSAPVVPQ